MELKKRTILAALVLVSAVFSCVYAKNGKPVKIWKNIDGMKNEPSIMYVHEADRKNNTGAAVIICPGGSYHHLGIYNEGYTTAEWFSKKGVTAFNLHYRTNEAGYHHPAMLQDLQRAIQLVRENAELYGIDCDKVGVIGFSAGGHLVTMAGAFSETEDELKKLGIDHEVSIRPDFVIPVYSVVSMQDEIAHKWSRNSLLGNLQSQLRKDKFSMEKQIPSSMPPVYIVVCKDDKVVDCRNSLELDKALEKAGVPHQLAIYDWGNHGFGMTNGKFMKTFHYNDKIWDWLISIDFGKALGK